MKKLSLVLLLFTCILPSTWAQDAVGIAIELIAVQKGDQGIDLQATVTDEEKSEPVSGLTFQFLGNQSIALGEATTNSAGIAELKGASLESLRKMGHAFSLTASFTGNEKFLKNETSIDIAEVNLALTAETIDSANTISVAVTSWNAKGEVAPFSEGEVKLYVPRMFSLLPIGDITTDEGGRGEFKFPSDLPGGTNGELIVVARIEEHAIFGSVEASTPTTWGVKPGVRATRLPRALWSPDAPLWMVITFAILMTGVWYHYVFIVYELFRVKRMSKAEDKLDYSE